MKVPEAIFAFLQISLLALAFAAEDTGVTSPPTTDSENGISDFINVGVQYWNRMRLGLFDTYDEGQFTLDLDHEQLKKENPDVKLNITELIQKYGFPVETHQVFTEDDYVLTLHRIPHGRSNQSATAGSVRPVVLLQHGLCSSSVDWIMNTVDKALPYMLADAGYDVWLGNARGNRFSTRNIRMSSKRSKFWDFSFHEIGIYDLPAVIDHILSTTGESELDYIAHSMGNSALLVLLSTKPSYNLKIRHFIALAPAVHLEDMKSPLRYLAPFSTIEKYVSDFLGNGQIISDSLLKFMHQVAPSACSEPESFTANICDNIMFALGGSNLEQLNITQLPVILSHTPSPCSTKSGAHFLQTLQAAQFQQYDYGLLGNLQRYGSFSPPAYKLGRVKVPVTIFWADNDTLCDPKGIRRLETELPNLAGSFRVNNSGFTHIDYLFAKDADQLVYKKVLQVLKLKVDETGRVKGLVSVAKVDLESNLNQTDPGSVTTSSAQRMLTEKMQF